MACCVRAAQLVLVEAEHGLFNEKEEGKIIVTENFVANFFVLVVWSILDGLLAFLALLPNLKYQKGAVAVHQSLRFPMRVRNRLDCLW